MQHGLCCIAAWSGDEQPTPREAGEGAGRMRLHARRRRQRVVPAGRVVGAWLGVSDLAVEGDAVFAAFVLGADHADGADAGEQVFLGDVHGVVLSHASMVRTSWIDDASPVRNP
jgi:hypothetical protein